MMQHDEQPRHQQTDLQNQNAWEELSDYDNMVDEDQLEPDYYIDRPVSAKNIVFNETFIAFSDLRAKPRG